MKEFLGIMFVLFVGLITYSSILFIYRGKKNKNNSFSSSLSIIFLILLTFSFLLPLTIQILNNKFVVTQSYAFVFLMSIISFIIFRLINKYDFNKELNFTNKEVLILVAFALFFLIEGLKLYSITTISIKNGITTLLKYSIYNILLGTIFLNYYIPKDKRLIKTLSFLTFLSFIGGLISYIFEIIFTKSFVIGIISSLTFGMFVYIILFILYPDFKNTSDRKSKVLGLLLGGFIYALTTLF